MDNYSIGAKHSDKAVDINISWNETNVAERELGERLALCGLLAVVLDEGVKPKEVFQMEILATGANTYMTYVPTTQGVPTEKPAQYRESRIVESAPEAGIVGMRNYFAFVDRAISGNGDLSMNLFDDIVQAYQGLKSQIFHNYGGFLTDEEIDGKLSALSIQYDEAIERFSNRAADKLRIGDELGKVLGDDIKAYGAAIKSYVDSGGRVSSGNTFGGSEKTDFTEFNSSREGQRVTASFSLNELSALFTARNAQLCPPLYNSGENLKNRVDAQNYLRGHKSDLGKQDLFEGVIKEMNDNNPLYPLSQKHRIDRLIKDLNDYKSLYHLPKTDAKQSRSAASPWWALF